MARTREFMMERFYDRAVQLLGEDVSATGLQCQSQLWRSASGRAAEGEDVASAPRYIDPTTDLATRSMYTGSGAVSTIVSIKDLATQSGVAAGSLT